MSSFSLSNTFVSKYVNRVAPFGFNGAGEMVYRRTYSRPLSNGVNEEWYQTVERVTNGTYRMQMDHINTHGLGWDGRKAQDSAEEMYERMFSMKFLPPGRGLWAMGSDLTEKRRLFATLNNCGFISTKDMDTHPSMPFEFLMDMSMLGVGVGFDVKGAGKCRVYQPVMHRPFIYVIPDSREGWVGAISRLINSYLTPDQGLTYYDFSSIRPYGEDIKGFGGVASGPKPIMDLIVNITNVLVKRVGELITITDIVDIMNMIGGCVVAGNVRRTAEIVFGPYDNDEYINLKNYVMNPDRAAYGWTSNNSVFADIGMDYTATSETIQLNGEPGYAWLSNMRSYGRMRFTEYNDRDHKVAGGNPCLEQSLESGELCCLVETFPAKHDTLDDFLRTLKFAYLYAKTVTLGETHWPATNRVLLRNRRIGCSMSGIAQFLVKHTLNDLKNWCEVGYRMLEIYDETYSNWFCIPRSIKMTSIKPSGTVSILAGATPGMHYPVSRFYIRRYRLSETSPLLPGLRQNGYHIEPSEHDPKTLVVSIPTDAGEGVRTIDDVSMWEQMSLAAFLQEHWADNQVSCTVTFNPETEGKQIKHALNYFQYKLKGISFLPKLKDGAYKQMPYEATTEEQYLGMLPGRVGKMSNKVLEAGDRLEDKFCDGESCEIPTKYTGVDAYSGENTLQTKDERVGACGVVHTCGHFRCYTPGSTQCEDCHPNTLQINIQPPTPIPNPDLFSPRPIRLTRTLSMD